MRRAFALAVVLAVSTFGVARSTAGFASGEMALFTPQLQQVPAACIPFDPVIDRVIDKTTGSQDNHEVPDRQRERGYTDTTLGFSEPQSRRGRWANSKANFQTFDVSFGGSAKVKTCADAWSNL